MLVEALQNARIAHLDLSGYVRVPQGASVADTLARMREHRATAALVEDGERRLVGIFTERDVLLKVVGDPARLRLDVDEVMTRRPQTVAPEDTAGHALRFMNSGHYRNVPVLDADRRIVGNLSQHAVIRFLTDHFPREVYNLPPDPELIPRTREGA